MHDDEMVRVERIGPVEGVASPQPIDGLRGRRSALDGPAPAARMPATRSVLQRTRRFSEGALVALVSFAALGTVSALWSNPLFTRMTPAGTLEVVLLAALSVLAGIFVGIRRAACSTRSAATGGVLGFLGIACPTCNKVLMLLFGGELLLAYYEPFRLYVAAAGVIILAAATIRAWRVTRRPAVAVRPATSSRADDELPAVTLPRAIGER